MHQTCDMSAGRWQCHCKAWQGRAFHEGIFCMQGCCDDRLGSNQAQLVHGDCCMSAGVSPWQGPAETHLCRRRRWQVWQDQEFLVQSILQKARRDSVTSIRQQASRSCQSQSILTHRDGQKLWTRLQTKNCERRFGALGFSLWTSVKRCS